jgi:hypothetical protein
LSTAGTDERINIMKSTKEVEATAGTLSEGPVADATETETDYSAQSVIVKVTGELSVDIDSLYFDADMDGFRPGDLQRDLIGECIAVKSGVYENAVWGNITSVVGVVASEDTESVKAEPPADAAS